jgi:hypothetical protein
MDQIGNPFIKLTRFYIFNMKDFIGAIKDLTTPGNGSVAMIDPFKTK